jgi:predicted NBD/HSP70 family sugar kinase
MYKTAWTLFHTFLPNRLILDGGMMGDQFELYADAMRVRLSHATQFTRGAGDIVRAGLGNDAGILGAASLAWRS